MVKLTSTIPHKDCKIAKYYCLKLYHCYRRLIWEENIEKIQRHNLEYDLGKHTYTMGINEYSDLVSVENYYIFIKVDL